MASKPKRLARRIALTAMLAAGLFVLYLAHYLSCHWLAGHGVMNYRYLRFARDTIFWPIDWFASSSAPTTPYIRATAEWCQNDGAGKPIPWRELFAYHEAARTGNPIPPPQPSAQQSSDSESSN